MSLKLTFLFLLCSYCCISQEIEISGKVLNDNSLPISYANVILVDKDDETNISGTITNSRGVFVLDDLKAGTYNLEISFVGYTGFNKELVIDKIITLEPVILKEIPDDELNVIEVIIDDNNQ